MPRVLNTQNQGGNFLYFTKTLPPWFWAFSTLGMLHFDMNRLNIGPKRAGVRITTPRKPGNTPHRQERGQHHET